MRRRRGRGGGRSSWGWSPVCVVVRSPRGGSGRGWWWRRHGLEVGNDGVDLRRLELILESRHARRAVGDDVAHDLVAAAGGILGQRRTILSAGDLRLLVAHHAGLIVKPHAQ